MNAKIGRALALALVALVSVAWPGEADAADKLPAPNTVALERAKLLKKNTRALYLALHNTAAKPHLYLVTTNLKIDTKADNQASLTPKEVANIIARSSWGRGEMIFGRPVRASFLHHNHLRRVKRSSCQRIHRAVIPARRTA